MKARRLEAIAIAAIETWQWRRVVAKSPCIHRAETTPCTEDDDPPLPRDEWCRNCVTREGAIKWRDRAANRLRKRCAAFLRSYRR